MRITSSTVVNKEALQLIIKECCVGLEYDSFKGIFTFCLRPGCGNLWQSLRTRLKDLCGGVFTLGEFNRCLDDLLYLHCSVDVQPLDNGIAIASLLPGECVEIESGKETLRLTKMAPQQFLAQSGEGFTFPSATRIAPTIPLVTSEGRPLILPEKVWILTPSLVHTVAGAMYLPGYYRRPVARSLWPLHSLAQDVLLIGGSCSGLLIKATEMGLGIQQMFNVINSTK